MDEDEIPNTPQAAEPTTVADTAETVSPTTNVGGFEVTIPTEDGKATLGEFLRIPDDLGFFILSLICCAALSFALSVIYRRWGFSLSNRSDFGRNFVLLSCTTMMVVTIVKSSLALSLGLVGALSIVRFRAAIKEPEELCFLFLAIAVGLGFGAGEIWITLIAFLFFTLVLWLRRRTNDKETGGDYHLLVASREPKSVRLRAIEEAVKGGTDSAALKRLDQSEAVLEISYQVHFTGPHQLAECHERLLGLGESVSVSIMDNRGLGN